MGSVDPSAIQSTGSYPPAGALGSGTPDGTKFLRDDLTWQTPSGGSGYNTVENEGTPLTQRTSLNFVGAGVTAEDSGGKTVVTIPGGAGASWTAVEQNLGATAATRGSFVLTDASITASSKVIIVQAPGPYTGKGTRADEAEMDRLNVYAEPGTGQAVVKWQTTEGITMKSPFQYPGGDSRVSTLAPPQDDTQARLIPSRIGKARGNFKFWYTIA